MALVLAPRKLLSNPLVLVGGVLIIAGGTYWAWKEGWLNWLFGTPSLPPPPDPGIIPPTIPPQSAYQLSRVTVGCDDVGIHSLNRWRVLLGVRPTPATTFMIHIILIDTVTRLEVAHFIDQYSVGTSTNHEYITASISGSFVSGLEACRTYNSYCYVTNEAGTESVFSLKIGAVGTRGCP